MSEQTISADHAIFLGRVAEWLRQVPSLDTDYGSFFVKSVDVSFEGDLIGRFAYPGDGWMYEAANEAAA